MYKFLIKPLLIFTLILTSPISYSLTPRGSVYHIDSIEEISGLVDKSTLIVFDLDHTLFEGSEYGYGHANWFYDLVAEGRAKGYSEYAIFNKMYPHWVYSQSLMPAKLIEPNALTFIKSLQEQGYTIMAATSRQPVARLSTLRQVKELGLSFDTAPLLKKRPRKQFNFSTRFKKGVLFCHDFNDKGQVIKAYLKENDLHFDKIILIEDSFGNINKILNAYKDDNVHVTGLYFDHIAKQKKLNWDPSVAKRAYLKKALEVDGLTPNLFFSDPDLVEDYSIKLNKALEHIEVRAFDMLDMSFKALPGVYTPDIMNDHPTLALSIPVANKRVLEIGAATGYYSSYAAKTAKKVIAVDNHPEAIKNIQLNANDLGLSNKVEARLGHLYEPIRNGEIFDVIYFDIPQIHIEKNNLSLAELSIFDPNYDLLHELLASSDKYLAKDGGLYLNYHATRGDMDYLHTLASHYHWQLEIVEFDAKTQDQIIKLIRA